MKSTSLLPVLFLTIQTHLCYSLIEIKIEIKIDNAKMASREVSFMGML